MVMKRPDRRICHGTLLCFIGVAVSAATEPGEPLILHMALLDPTALIRPCYASRTKVGNHSSAAHAGEGRHTHVHHASPEFGGAASLPHHALLAAVLATEERQSYFCSIINVVQPDPAVAGLVQRNMSLAGKSFETYVYRCILPS